MDNTAKTYDWIMATALSKVRRRIWVTIKPAKRMLEARAVWFPKRVISRWPATILAISRTDRVMGRIIFLTDSISTIKGIRTEGVLWGTIWANMWLVWLSQPYTIKVSQRGKARVRVRVKWLDAVKM